MAAVPSRPRAGSSPLLAAAAGQGDEAAAERAAGLTGREQELGELRRLARPGALITLAGAGGAGKTRLLRALLAAVADEYPDGAFRADLGDARPDLVPSRVAAVTGVSEEPGVPLVRTLARVLGGRRAVLALDGCDLVAGACADLCARLLDGSRDLLVIAASVKPLDAAGETVWQVGSLGMPAPGEDDPVRAAESGAVRLFAERARAARPGFALEPADCPAVAAICRAAGGLPLGIKLAAARTADLSPGQIAAGLADGLPVPDGQAITSDGPAAPRAVIAWAYGLLAPEEQVLLRRLSVMEGWSLEAAERVCADDALPAARIAGLMGRLAGRALVERRNARRGPDRYWMPGPVRHYAAGLLEKAGETAPIRRRLRDYAEHLADYASSIGTVRVPVSWPVLMEVFSTYEAQAGNIRAALAWCLEDGDAEAGLRICAALRTYWDVRGAASEGTRWLAAFLAASPAGVPAAVRGAALVARAHLALVIGDLREAQSQAEAGLELCRDAEDTGSESAALGVLARAALSAGRPEEAAGLAAQALEITGRSRDWWNRGYAIGSMSAALAAMGRLAEARQQAEAGLALMTDIDHQWGAAMFRVTIGDLARRAGDLAAARDSYLAALPVIRDLMPAPEAARCLARLGTTALAQGDLPAARGHLTESLQLSLAAGQQAAITRVLLALADLSARENAPGRAVTLAAAVTGLSRQAGLPPPPARRIQRCLSAAASLGPDHAGRLWADGLTLTTEEAARLALAVPCQGSGSLGEEQQCPDAISGGAASAGPASGTDVGRPGAIRY